MPPPNQRGTYFLVSNLILIKKLFIMKIKKLVIREHIEIAELVSKKAQKWFLGGYDDCGPGEMEFRCFCSSGSCGCHKFYASSIQEALARASAYCLHMYNCPGTTCAGPGEYPSIGC